MTVLHENVGHQNIIDSLMFSPDGNRILSGSWDGTAKLWDIHTGELLHTFLWETSQVHSVAWSCDGKTLAVGGEAPPRHFTEAELGRLQTAFERRDYSNCQIPDVANPPTDEVRLFDADTGSLIHTLPNVCQGIGFAPNGKNVAVLSWEGLSIFDASGEQLTNTSGSKLDLRNVFYSEDSQQVACAGSDGICVFDAHSAALQFIASDPHLFREHDLAEFEQHVTRLPNIPEELKHEEMPAYLTRFWQELLPGFRPSSDQGMGYQQMAFSPDNKRVAILSNNRHALGPPFAIPLEGITIYHLENQKIEWFFQSPNQKWVRTLSFSPNGKLLASAGDAQQIFLWDLETGREVSRIGNPPAKIHSVAFSPSEPYLVAGNAEGTLVLYDTRNSNAVTRNDSCNASIVHLEFSPTADAILLGTSDGRIRLLDVPELQTVVEFPAHRGRFLGGVFSEDGENYLSVGHREKSRSLSRFDQSAEVVLWSLSSNCKLDELQFPDEIRVGSVAGSPDRKRLAIAISRRVPKWRSCQSGTTVKKRKVMKTTCEVLLCDIARPIRCERVFRGEEFFFNEVAFTKDGLQHLIVGSEGYRMKVLNIAQQRETLSFIARRDGPSSFAVSSDGKRLFRGTAYRNEIEGFDLTTGKLTQELNGHQNSVNSLSISPDGQLIASGGDDGTIKLWSAETSKLIASMLITT